MILACSETEYELLLPRDRTAWSLADALVLDVVVVVVADADDHDFVAAVDVEPDEPVALLAELKKRQPW